MSVRSPGSSSCSFSAHPAWPAATGRTSRHWFTQWSKLCSFYVSKHCANKSQPHSEHCSAFPLSKPTTSSSSVLLLTHACFFHIFCSSICSPTDAKSAFFPCVSQPAPPCSPPPKSDPPSSSSLSCSSYCISSLFFPLPTIHPSSSSFSTLLLLGCCFFFPAVHHPCCHTAASSTQPLHIIFYALISCCWNWCSASLQSRTTLSSRDGTAPPISSPTAGSITSPFRP